MTTDSAGIVERLREHATALREKASYTCDIDANRLGAQADECDKAAAHIEAQAVELEKIERYENVLRRIADAPAWGAPERWETTPAEVRQLARAALGAKP